MLLPIAAHRGTGASCGASNSFQLHRVRQPQPHTPWPLRCSAQPRGSSTAALVDPRMAAALRARRPPTERSRNHAIGHAGLDGASCHRRLRSVAHGLRQRLLPEPRRSHLISTVSVAVIPSEIFRTGGLSRMCKYQKKAPFLGLLWTLERDWRSNHRRYWHLRTRTARARHVQCSTRCTATRGAAAGLFWRSGALGG